jgi:hypothetical protein
MREDGNGTSIYQAAADVDVLCRTLDTGHPGFSFSAQVKYKLSLELDSNTTIDEFNTKSNAK